MGLSECTFLLLSCINLVKPFNTRAGVLDQDTMRRYSFAMNKASLKYNVSPYLLLGIFKVESNLGRKAITSHTNDHGPMQINYWWFDRLKISKKTVDTPEGAMFIAAKILHGVREDHGKGACWWSTYHSITPVHRRKYERDVLNALAELGFQANCKSDFLNDWESAKSVTARLRDDVGVKLAELKEK